MINVQVRRLELQTIIFKSTETLSQPLTQSTTTELQTSKEHTLWSLSRDCIERAWTQYRADPWLFSLRKVRTEVDQPWVDTTLVTVDQYYRCDGIQP